MKRPDGRIRGTTTSHFCASEIPIGRLCTGNNAARREERAPERILTDAEIMRLAKRPPRNAEALCEALHGAAERAEDWTDEVLVVLRDHSSGFF